MRSYKRLLVLDFDKTLTPVRSILFVAEKLGFKHEVEKIFSLNIGEREKSILIARHLAGLRESELKSIAMKLPMRPWVRDLLEWASSNGFYTAVVTLAYDVIVSTSLRGLPVDAIYAPQLRVDNGVIKGVDTNSFTQREETPWCIKCGLCKRLIVKNLMAELQISRESVIAIGDGLPDACVFLEAGCSIAVKPSNELVAEKASAVIRGEENPLTIIKNHCSTQLKR